MNNSMKKRQSKQYVIEKSLEIFDGDEKKLCDALYKLNQLEQQKLSEQKSVKATEVNKNLVKVFDIYRLNEIKENTSTNERSLRAVLDKFDLCDDTGYRELKSITKKFVDGVEALKIKYPNCHKFLELISDFGALTLCRSGANEYVLPPILLTGPPGVGKTAVVNEIAALLDVTCHQIDYATVTAGFIISGSSTVWSEGKTGCIVDMLRDGDAANSILILDEIDKVCGDQRYNPLGSLFTLLEKKMASKFVDEALNTPINASNIIFIATANDVTEISDPLRSRFIEIEIGAIEGEHHRVVTQSIYSSMLKDERLEESFTPQLSNPVFDALYDYSPREIKLMLSCAISKAARRCGEENQVKVSTSDFTMLENNSRTHHNPIGFIW